jgi:hypothetical protein
MDNIEEIIEATTIKFPRPIDREDSENLLGYLAKKLPGNISGKVEYYISFNHPNLINDGVLKEEGTLKISGVITSYDPLVFDTFESKPWNDDTTYISEIAFSMGNGNLSEYNQEKRQLWGNVRELVGQYFSRENKETKKSWVMEFLGKYFSRNKTRLSS